MCRAAWAPHAPSVAQDIQHLLLWVAGDGIGLKWVLVKAKPMVQKICIVHIPGLQLPLYSRAGVDCFPKLSALCPASYPTKVVHVLLFASRMQGALEGFHTNEFTRMHPCVICRIPMLTFPLPLWQFGNLSTVKGWVLPNARHSSSSVATLGPQPRPNPAPSPPCHPEFFITMHGHLCPLCAPLAPSRIAIGDS